MTGRLAITKIGVRRAFWTFLLLHAFLWTLLPVLFHRNAPLDVVEAISWGREWQLGYYKHPPLAFWLANLAYLADGGRLWAIFLLSQLSIATGLWAVWRIASEALDEWRALAACVLLEGVIYFNFTSPEFNPNVLELAIWPLIVLFAWRALGNGTTGSGKSQSSAFLNWAGLGVCAGFGLFAKYYTAVLLISLLVFLIADREARCVWRHSGPYVSIAIALAVFSPHAWWMLHTRLATVSYAMNRAASHGTELTRLTFPLKFCGAQLLALLPMLVAFLLLFGWWKPDPAFRSNMKARLLLALVAGPFLLTLLLSVLFNWRLLSMWGTPLWSFLPLLLLWSSRDLRRIRFEQVAVAGVLLMALIGGAFAVPLTAGPYLSGKPRKALFGGEQMGREITQRWQQEEGTPLRLVVGDTWMAGNLAFYSPDRPSVLTDGNFSLSPWVSPDELRTKGAVVVWEGPQPPAAYSQLSSQMKIQGPVRVAWHTHAHVADTPVYWAIIPPQH
jgi:4-amino-4-deoxy-L-arabinose transferase-like glycosyltransferase